MVAVYCKVKTFPTYARSNSATEGVLEVLGVGNRDSSVTRVSRCVNGQWFYGFLRIF